MDEHVQTAAGKLKSRTPPREPSRAPNLGDRFKGMMAG